LGTLLVKPKEFLIGFEVILLFTKVHTRQTLNHLSPHSDEYNVRLSHHVLTIFVFLYRLYEQTDKAVLAGKKLGKRRF
jgi:hypothetical protein